MRAHEESGAVQGQGRLLKIPEAGGEGRSSLSDDQRNVIIGAIKEAQSRFAELQWQLHNEMETLASLLQPSRPDEPRALAQLDKVLNLEREIKRIHLTLVLRIKNTLSAEQQAKLRTIMAQLRGK